MANRKSIELLPSLFRTDTNRKFLSATVDQLISEPEFARLNGYIGRKFAPTYRTTDTYISENDRNRQNYQLEPSVVIKNSDKEVEFYSNYNDLINKISALGGIVDNHDRLFNNDYYTYDGLFDQDKFVNFSQYYWLPNGPAPILIESKIAAIRDTFNITRYEDVSSINFNNNKNLNPELVLVRGGTYEFVTTEAGYPFYIQTEPGINGQKSATPNISSRDVLGTVDNGATGGRMTFRVPLENAQDVYLKMPIVEPVDFAIEQTFADIDGKPWQDILTSYNGFDGTDVRPNEKLLIFVTPSFNANDWTRSDGTTVPEDQRSGVFFVREVNGIINLEYVRAIPVNHRVYARIGLTKANKQYYSTNTNMLIEVPPLTAQLDTLYYQDGRDPNMFGRIKLVDNAIDPLNIDDNIIGKKNYVTQSGIEFTNGMVIRFDDLAEPTRYANKKFVVEGVGKSIRLVDFDDLVFPESGLERSTVPWDIPYFDEGNFDEPIYGPTQPDYITINRASQDLNPWSRQNRWFHISVIVKSAEINGVTATIDQAVRAKRPIIEFEPDIQLYKFGKIGKRAVNFIDSETTDAFNLVQHNSQLRIGNQPLRVGQRVLFVNDRDNLVRTQIYRVDYNNHGEPAYTDFYDQAGQGTITVEKNSIGFISVAKPQLIGNQNGLYQYNWVINSTKPDIQNAVSIERIDYNDTLKVGTVTGVNQTANQNEYIVSFTVPSEIQIINSKTAKIKSNSGTRVVQGTGTKFLTDVEIGSVIVTDTNQLVGKVAVVFDDNTLLLEQTCDINFQNRNYKFKELKLQLVVSDSPEDQILANDVIVALDGNNKGISYYFDGLVWHKAQTKTKINQPPLFDIFDNQDKSFSLYKNSDFKGTKIFSYTVGTGKNDAALGFPLSFRSAFGSLGSILSEMSFNNDYGIDSFNYFIGNESVNLAVDQGYIKQNINREQFVKRNVWAKAAESSRQYQIISATFTGASNYFEIDITPDAIIHSSTIKVFLNNNLLTNSDYQIAQIGVKQTVRVDATLLAVGDKIDILVYSRKSISNLGYYQIPTNLDLNSKNQRVQTLTIGQLRNNLITVSQNIPELKGTVPGENNLRDIDYKKYNGNIVQNSAPLIYSNLFLIHEQANIVQALDFARREYSKFKNKFLELCVTTPGLNIDDPKTSVDQILSVMNQVKNINFPWHYSDMVPYGEAESTVYRVVQPRDRQYRINRIYRDIEAQSRAVLIYHNGQQLLKGRDYHFRYDIPVVVLSDDLNIVLNDTIEIREYNTDGNYIPETPTKLGLYPKFMPRIYFDDTFRINPVNNLDTAAYFAVSDGTSHRNLIIKLENPALIAEARLQLSGAAPKKHITGIIVAEPAPYNPYYSYHYDPDTIEFFEVSMEVCDSTFKYVEENLEDVGEDFLPGNRLCPWGSEIVSEVTQSINIIGAEMIRGHDGSLTPVFNDHRDQFLLELESRIYNNIKIDPNKSVFDIRTLIPGRFRDNDYSLKEFSTIISSQFLKWVGANRVDYVTNKFFRNGDAFTYNYSTTRDILFDESIPGYWRAIYRYFYDTDKPHMAPWEMLGFAEQPNWWIEEYGPAPYTSGNEFLWQDLENGFVRRGPQTGVRKEYARPGLSRIIPVDDKGNLKPPLSVLAINFSTNNASNSFAIGDGGPVESAWKHSSEYPYAVQIAAALMKPGLYLGTLFDLENYYKNEEYDQYLYAGTKNCVRPTDIKINGSKTANNEVVRSRGYINWIVDYITSLGINGPTKVKSLLDRLEVQLSYKVGGFTDKKYLTILAEQYSPTSINDSVIIPDESYSVVLHKSVPISKVSYSAVIIEKTGAGFAITGYNANNPYFTVVPSQTTGESYVITVDKIKATIYQRYRREKLIIPYGTVFRTRQQVVDFLVSYQRFLYSQGFAFDDFNEDLMAAQDWILSAKEFLTWTLQGWKNGSILVLSPVANKLKLVTFNSVVDAISNDTNRNKLLDVNFNIIRTSELNVLRDTNEFKVTALSGKTIALAELDLIQYEHVLIFDNATVFNDIIYAPDSGSRQYRLKLVGSKTANWNGSFSAPGFIFNNSNIDQWISGRDYKKGDIVQYKNQYYVAVQNVSAQTSFNVNYFKAVDKDTIKVGLLPNFSNNAEKFTDIYDTDGILLDEKLAEMSSGLIGYRSRDYLNNLTINNTSQLKFYQGYIKDKGTLKAAQNLSSAVFSNLQNQVTVSEEWAFRVGEYGATNSTSIIEVLLDETVTPNNPVGINIVEHETDYVEGFYNLKVEDLYNQVSDFRPIRFLNRLNGVDVESDLETAGYVNIDDVDISLYNLSNTEAIKENLSSLYSGVTIWIAKDSNSTWNVYRVTENESSIVEVAYSLDNTLLVKTSKPHGLAENSKIIIKNFDSRINDMYEVSFIVDATSFAITVANSVAQQIRGTTIRKAGLLLSLNSVRFFEPGNIEEFTPPHGWRDNDLIWIDRNKNNKWAVYKKGNPWNYSVVNQNLPQVTPNSNLQTSVKLSRDQQILVVGSPAAGSGRINIYFNDSFTGSSTAKVFRPAINDISQLGFAVDATKDYVFAGAPASYNGKGAVTVFRSNQGNLGNYFTVSQLIYNDLIAQNASMGYALSVSDDSKWLYVGCPGINAVYLYRLVEFETRTDYFDTSEAQNGLLLPYTVTDPESIAVYVRGNFYTYGKDYTVNTTTNKVEFNPDAVPELGDETGLTGFAFAAETNFVQSSVITVVRRSYYRVASYSVGESIDSKFGYSLKTTSVGDFVLVGAPDNSSQTDIGLLEVGKAFVYARSADNSLKLVHAIVPPYPTYKGKFGTSVDMYDDLSNIFVGSPGHSQGDYSGGIVYRFIDHARFFGTVESVANPIIKINDSIFVNGVEVKFTGRNLETAVQDINQANIVGVTASLVDSRIKIVSSVVAEYTKLVILPGIGSTYYSLGFSPIKVDQEIRKPLNTTNDNFGQYISLNTENNTIGIASTSGTSKNFAKLDKNSTLFDSGSTVFVDISTGSGAVYLYELLENSQLSTKPQGVYVLGQAFTAPNPQINDKFGSSLTIGNNLMVIAAGSDTGSGYENVNVHRYTNSDALKFWNLHREKNAIVDVLSINSISLYDAKTKSKLVNLDYIDPNKNKCLGIAEENIDYKSTFDPAAYNAGLNYSAGSIDYHWGVAHVGRTWWNLSNSKFVDYEQDSLTYRISNWGKLFPGSRVTVYEWVESDVVPSQYQARGNIGEPLYPDDSAYVSIGYAEAGSGIIRNKYYYWVRGITSVKSNVTRSVSVVGIENAVENPKAQGIPYAAILSDHSIALYNCESYIRNADVVLKIDYDNKINNNIIHSEYQLVPESAATSQIPGRIVDKLIDSISGIDRFNNVVPDPALKLNQNIGLEIRPRQTLIVNKWEALRNLIVFANNILENNLSAYKIQNVLAYDTAAFFAKSALPGIDEYDEKVNSERELEYVEKIEGKKVLVVRDMNYQGIWTIYRVDKNRFKLIKNQSYDTTELWNYKTWYAKDYNPLTAADYELDFYNQIQQIAVSPGLIVKINKTSAGGREIYRFNNNLEPELVGVENGALQLQDFIYDLNNNSVGYDNNLYENIDYDKTYGLEIRNLITGLLNEIFVDDLVEYQSKLLFVLINYIMTEQEQVDWVFKTSFISVLHKIKNLFKYPNFSKDNHNYYESYLNEVKPYKTKIREYKIGYTDLDIVTAGITDFDLPGYWDNDLKRFRSASGEFADIDQVNYQKPENIDWYNNHKFGVESIIVADPGQSYTLQPQVKIIANGDNGEGAEATALINEVTGRLQTIQVTNPGRNYVNTPFVIITGNGFGARAYAQLSNKKVRSLKTVLKFDRVSYTSSVTEWIPNKQYRVNDTVSYQGKGYRVITNHSSPTFAVGFFTLLDDGYFVTANDRLAATYYPGPNQIPREVDTNGNVNLKRIIPGITDEYNLINTDDSVYNETLVVSTHLDNTTDPEDINAAGGKFYDLTKSFAPEELVPGKLSDSVIITVETVINENKYIYKMVKSETLAPKYYAVSADKLSRLASPLGALDKKIYLTRLDNITKPDVPKRRPGRIVINGEIIHFFHYNPIENAIVDPIRGVDGTAIAAEHPIDAVVIDQGNDLKVPTTVIKSSRYTFTKNNPVFLTGFTVPEDRNLVKNLLSVYNGYTKLELDKDYTFDIVDTPLGFKAEIRFTRADSFSDGVRFRAEYVEDRVWLNIAQNTITDGLGLDGSQQNPALFVKQFPHTL